jgi:hypothetical protein
MIKKYWTFKLFISGTGIKEFENWLNVEIPTNAKARIKTKLTYLEITKQWTPDLVTKYKSSDKIHEIRVTVQNIQYRPLGCYGPKDKEFTLLIGAIEKGGKLIPRSALKIAKERRRLIFQEETYTYEYI